MELALRPSIRRKSVQLLSNLVRLSFLGRPRIAKEHSRRPIILSKWKINRGLAQSRVWAATCQLVWNGRCNSRPL